MKKRIVRPEESELILSEIENKDDKALDKKSKTKKIVLGTAVGTAVAMVAGVAVAMPNQVNGAINAIDTGIYDVSGIIVDLNNDGVTGETALSITATAYGMEAAHGTLSTESRVGTAYGYGSNHGTKYENNSGNSGNSSVSSPNKIPLTVLTPEDKNKNETEVATDDPDRPTLVDKFDFETEDSTEEVMEDTTE